jgi:hypothetical protein
MITLTGIREAFEPCRHAPSHPAPDTVTWPPALPCFRSASAWSVESVTFESGSRLEQIDECAFCENGLRSILIPSSVGVSGERSFSWCRSLEFVEFGSGSRLERIDKSMFEDSRVSFSLVSRQFTRSTNGRNSRKNSGSICWRKK